MSNYQSISTTRFNNINNINNLNKSCFLIDNNLKNNIKTNLIVETIYDMCKFDLHNNYCLYRQAREGKSGDAIGYFTQAVYKNYAIFGIVPNSTNLSDRFVEKCNNNNLKVQHVTNCFKSVKKPTKKEYTKIVNDIVSGKCNGLIGLCNHHQFVIINKVIILLNDNNKKSVCCIDEIDDVIGAKDSNKLSDLQEVINSVENRVLCMTATPFLVWWTSMISIEFRQNLKVIISKPHTDFINFKSPFVKISEIKDMEFLNNKTKKDTEWLSFLKYYTSQFNSYYYNGKYCKKQITTGLIVCEFLKDNHFKLQKYLLKLYPNALFVISNGSRDVIVFPQKKIKMNGCKVLEKTMCMLEDKRLVDNASHVFVIGYTKLLRGVSPRTERDTFPSYWSEMLMATNHLFVPRSEDAAHDILNQGAFRIINGIYPGDKTNLQINLFTPDRVIDSINTYDSFIQRYTDNIITPPTKDNFGVVKMSPLEDSPYAPEGFQQQSAYKKEKQKTENINGNWISVNEQKEKEKTEYYKNNHDYEIDNIRRKFDVWSKSNNKIGNLARKINPEKFYTKNELSELILSCGYKESSTIINKLQTPTTKKNGYGVILEKVSNCNDCYRVLPELVDDYNKLILKK